MKGLYVARLDLGQPHLMGVRRKIDAQIKALAAAGMPASLLCTRDGAIELDGRIMGKPAPGRWDKRFNHHLRFHRAMEQAALDADFAYIRFQGAPPGFVSALARLRRVRPRMPILLELPSWPFATERRGPRMHAVGAYEDLGLRKLRGLVDRIVTFSTAEEILGVETICIDNGVDLEEIAVSTVSADDNPLRFVGVANLSFWHGYDRIIAGLAEYRTPSNAPHLSFEIIGSGAELPRLQAQVARLGVGDLVHFHGSLHGAQLDRLLANCQIAISSIGMHRLDVDTSNIKSREFCARGLPFLIGYPDRDFPDSLPFVFHLPPDDSPADIGAIVEWYRDLRAGHANLAQEMRRYAEAHLTWHSKFRPVIDWLRKRSGSHAAQPTPLSPKTLPLSRPTTSGPGKGM